MEGIQWKDKNAVWNYEVFKALLGSPFTLIKKQYGFAIWNKPTLAKTTLVGSKNVFEFIMVSDPYLDKKTSIRMGLKLKFDYASFANLTTIYPGLIYSESEETVSVVTNDMTTAFIVLNAVVAFNVGKKSLKEAATSARGLINDVYYGEVKDRIAIIKAQYKEMLSSLDIDTLETYVNMPAYMSNEPLNIAMEEERNKMFYEMTDRKDKIERFVRNKLSPDQGFKYDVGDTVADNKKKKMWL